MEPRKQAWWPRSLIDEGIDGQKGLECVKSFLTGEHNLYGLLGFGGYGKTGHGFHRHRGGHRGRHRALRHWFDWRTSADTSSSDSDGDCGEGCDQKSKKSEKREKKKFKKCMKRMHKCCQSMSFAPNCPKTQCTLCWHRIRPLVDTEVLDCGHIYHRFCLKELFGLALKTEEKDVFCSECKQRIDDKLIDKLKIRFSDESTEQQVINDLKKFEILSIDS